MKTASIYSYEEDGGDVQDIGLERACQFVSEHASDIVKVERSTAWAGPHLHFPEVFSVMVHVIFTEHSLYVTFGGRGVNVERGTFTALGKPVENWPLEYEVTSDEADAFYQAALAEQEAARQERQDGFLPPEPPDLGDE